MKNKNTKTKLFLNILLSAIILFVIFYLVEHSLGAIFAELLSTSWWVLIAVVVLGTVYQITEGKVIKSLAEIFTPDFSTKDGFWASCYVAFYRIVSFGTGTLISEVYFYNKKGLPFSKGIGVTTLHMIIYKIAVITYAVIGLILQFLLFPDRSSKLFFFILAGIVLTMIIIAFLLMLSMSLNLQILFVFLTDKFIKQPAIREKIDNWNLHIYSLREAMAAVIKNKTTFWQIYVWNLLKLAIWYIIPYITLIENHPNIDFLVTFSYISFAVVLSGVLPTPSGIGSFEFVYMLLFRPVVGTVDSASSLLLYRFSTFVLPFVYGFFYVLGEKRKEIQMNISEAKKEKA
jgi:uncharacterized membrane protein YbhN (UPF0104 family)